MAPYSSLLSIHTGTGANAASTLPHCRGLQPATRQRRLSPATRITAQRGAAVASSSTSDAGAVRYLYDGECPLRRPEVEMLKRLDGGKGRIDFVDIAPLEYDPAQNEGITYEEAMGAPAAILPDGTVIRSVEVYRRLYEAVGLGFVWAAAELPVMGDLVKW